MKLSLHPLVLRGPFAFAFGFLMALCFGLAGCDSSPSASGYTLLPTAKPVTGRTLQQTLDSAAPSANLRQFSAKGHVLGFDVGSVLVASGNHALKVEFVNANPVAPQSDQSGGNGKDNKTPALSEVRYPGLWQGIDLSYKAEPNGIAETVWKLEPGADINQARLRYNRPLALNQNGSLNINYSAGNLTESAPIAWQEMNGQRKPVTVAFALNGEQELGFKLGTHDSALPVWIDPTLSWNTFLGGAGGDFGYAIAVDGSGNVYVTGISYSSWGNPLRAFGSGSYDAFAAKLDSSGKLVWNTFLGGTGMDSGHDIAVDGSGYAYVAGSSDASWGNPQQAFAGKEDAFVAKFDSNTGQLIWNTFLGSEGYDVASAIAMDGSGNFYVAGSSDASWGNPLRPFSGGSYDAFATKFDSTGQLVWNTFLGGTGLDSGYGIAVDGGGNAYVTGISEATWGNPQRAFGGINNAFAAKLDSSGHLVWNTFLGGTDYASGDDIAVDESGKIYVAGHSTASWGSPQQAFGSGGDAFAAKLDSPTGQLVWNTFLGGTDYASGDDIAVDGSGNVYLGGSSGATWGNPQRVYGGSYDAFVAKLASDIITKANASINCLFNWAEQQYAGLFAPSGTATAVSGDYTYRYYSSTNAYLRVSSANRHVSYQLAGGASQDVGPLTDWLPVAGCPIPPPQTECLFNWAETNYPGLFAPSGFATAVWDVYTYRYYSATKAYLGVSSVDDHVYYLGQDGTMLDEGPTSYWFPLASCQ